MNSSSVRRGSTGTDPLDPIDAIEASLPAEEWFYTTERISKATGMSLTTIRRLVERGELGSVRSVQSGSARILVPRHELIRWLRERYQPAVTLDGPARADVQRQIDPSQERG